MTEMKAIETTRPTSLEGFVTTQDGTTITPNKLKRLDVSTISSQVPLLINVDALTVLIHREGILRIRFIYRVLDGHPWAKKYGSYETARAMSDVTGRMPEEIRPPIIASAWVRPSTVSWELSLPLSARGDDLLKTAHTSVESVKILALGLLKARFPEVDAVT